MSTAPRVALYETKKVPGYVNVCTQILAGMAESEWLQDPPIALAVVEAHVEALLQGELAAFDGGKAATTRRNAALRVVRADMRLLKAYVQSVVDRHPAEAALIISQARMSVARSTAWTKATFKVRRGQLSGTVVLDARAVARRATYCWQMSTDGIHWTDLPLTLTSTTLVEGLTPGAVYHFRYRTLTRAGMSDWGQVISLVVV